MALILIIVMVRKEFKTVIERLLIYLLIATFLREAVLLASAEHQSAYRKVCSVFGALNFYTATLVITYGTSTVLYILGRILWFKQHQRSKTFAKNFEIVFVLLTSLFPLIISISLLYADIFGSSIAWCWIQAYDEECRVASKKAIVSIILVVAALNIFLVIAFVVTYFKVSQRIEGARNLLKQPLLLITCLILNIFIGTIAPVIINLGPIEQTSLLYTYTVVLSLCDVIYPLGFLVTLKYQTLFSVIRRRLSPYAPVHMSVNATSPFSDRVSARSTTVPIALLYTGEFTNIESTH